jgi:undecaprenyl diphosphate synthase
MAGLFSRFNDKTTVLPDIIPNHIAFIMDGNGRWAKKRGLPRSAGHSAGAAAFKKVIEYCYDAEVKTITVYAFSTENWKRSEDEIKGIVSLLDEYLDDCIHEEYKKNIRVRFLGDQSKFGKELAEKITESERVTEKNQYNLNIALNYGGRDELCRAFRLLQEKGITAPTEEDISSVLYTTPTGDPDIIVRTGGEMRISNFLLWQSAYSEFYFTDTLWPDLGKQEIHSILHKYAKTHRRFGGV